MAFFGKKMRTAQQKANRAQLGILARLLGCGYLIYIMVELIQTTRSDEGATDATVKIIIAGLFLLASVVIIFFTALEFVRNSKTGFYKASFYTDDFRDIDESGQTGDDLPGIEDGDDSDGNDLDDDDGDYEEYDEEDDPAQEDESDQRS